MNLDIQCVIALTIFNLYFVVVFHIRTFFSPFLSEKTFQHTILTYPLHVIVVVDTMVMMVTNRYNLNCGFVFDYCTL